MHILSALRPQRTPDRSRLSRSWFLRCILGPRPRARPKADTAYIRAIDEPVHRFRTVLLTSAGGCVVKHTQRAAAPRRPNYYTTPSRDAALAPRAGRGRCASLNPMHCTASHSSAAFHADHGLTAARVSPPDPSHSHPPVPPAPSACIRPFVAVLATPTCLARPPPWPLPAQTLTLTQPQP